MAPDVLALLAHVDLQVGGMLLPVIVFLLGSVTAAAQPATIASTQVARDVRAHLMSLPYYGVFDLITFNVDHDNVVTLGGFVVDRTVKKDAEREAREVKGIKEVRNRIEIAPALPMDDDIRHAVYHAIYGDTALSRYGTPDNELWSMRPAFRAWGERALAGRPLDSPRLMAGPFFGYDPIGNYAIHIIVKNLEVTLAGVVESEGDKTLAEMRARSVTNIVGLNNDLAVATKSSETK